MSRGMNECVYHVIQDQYKYLHHLAVCYLQNFDTYANFK